MVLHHHVMFLGKIALDRHPELLARALREYPFDTILVSLGAMHAAVRPFYDTVMPVARHEQQQDDSQRREKRH